MKSKRLHIRRFTIDDLDFLQSIMKNPSVMQHTGFRTPQEDSKIKELLNIWIHENKQKKVFAIELIENQSLVGWAMINDQDDGSSEIGFMFDQMHWSNGYATELTKTLIEICFNQFNIPKVIATVSSNNIASIKVLEKNKMSFIKSVEDIRYYQILRDSKK